MKRVLSFLLVMVMTATVMLLVVPPIEVSAASMTVTELKEQVTYSYTQAKKLSGKSNFSGLCGTMVGYQLKALGINPSLWAVDGKDHYDHYITMKKTSSGYKIALYPASSGSIEQILNTITQNGTKDAYNLLLGFQKGYGEAGEKHGHVMFVNGIINGTVYFCESGGVTIGGKRYSEGSVISCSISTFANYYKNACIQFEGIVHFYTCTEFEGLGICKECGQAFNWEKTFDKTAAGTYTVVNNFTPRTDAPYSDATQASVSLKTGGTVTVVGAYENAYTQNNDDKWYKFTYNNGQSEGYVFHTYLSFSKPNALNVQCTGFKPSSNASLPQGQSYTASGTISSNYPLKSVEAYLDGSKYTTWTASDQKTTSLNIQSTVISSKLNFANMSLGTHTIKLKATDVHNQTSTFFTVSFNIVNNPANNTLRVNYHVNGGTITGSNYYLSDSMVYLKSTSKLVAFVCQYGVKVDNGLHNDTTFGLVRDGYKFVGWSLTADGSGEIFDQDMPCKPEDLVPDLVNGNKTVTMYAIWEKIGCDHSYTYKFNSSSHWKECRLCGDKQSASSHNFTNSCDPSCSTCEYTRTITHTYDSTYSYDSVDHWKHCTVCGNYGTFEDHSYTNNCDTNCNICGYTRTTEHSYDNDCDATCNVCGDTRNTEHNYDAYDYDFDHHWKVCSVCGDADEATEAHSISSVYYLKDIFYVTYHFTDCTVCGGELGYRHKYTNDCDASCNDCEYTRNTKHSYDHDCDTDCNICGETRSTQHIYDNENDTTCNICGEVRTVETLPSSTPEDTEPSTEPNTTPDTNNTPSNSNKNDNNNDDKDNNNTTIIIVAVAGAVTVSTVSILGTAFIMKKKR